MNLNLLYDKILLLGFCSYHLFEIIACLPGMLTIQFYFHFNRSRTAAPIKPASLIFISSESNSFDGKLVRKLNDLPAKSGLAVKTNLRRSATVWE